MITNEKGGVTVPPRIIPQGLTFGGLCKEGDNRPAYPKWLYKNGSSPLKVMNVEEEAQARAEGWESVTAGMMANKTLINWVWDLEDMSSKQLCVYAKDEFGVELPANADQDKLFVAVLELIRCAPQNRDRLVLMAHTIKMNYDETLEEIRCMVAGKRQGVESDTITEEFWA
jgi:hypothetical protein